MIARIGRAVRAALLMPFAVVLVAVPVAHAKPRPAPPTPAYSPPSSERSPFSKSDTFCDPQIDKFETVAPTDPTLRAQPAVVTWLVAPGTTGVAASQADDIESFARLVDRCGGIGGRPLDVHVVRASGDPARDCAGAVDRFHPVIVVSSDLPDAWSCIVHDRRTILVTGAEVSNAELTGSGGRLVAAGSDEGVERARLLALVDSGRLDGHKVAIVAGSDAAGEEFRTVAERQLVTRHLRPVPLAAADTVLGPALGLAALPALQTATAPTVAKPLGVYSLGDADPAVPAALLAQPPATAARLARTVQLYAFTPVTDTAYRASQEPNTFSRMCNGAAVDATRPGPGSTTTTTEAQPPLTASFLTTADVCLLSRVVTRALYSAGPTLDQRSLVVALHRLPYIDQTAPGGTRRPRPNQVVNEAVRRIEQTVVLEQVQSSCPAPATPASDTTTSTTTTTTTPAGPPSVLCWLPAPEWDGGGVVVNVPLPATPVVVSH